jgi:hypothetical protein
VTHKLLDHPIDLETLEYGALLDRDFTDERLRPGELTVRCYEPILRQLGQERV